MVELSAFDLKLIAMVVISIGSLFFGLLPACLNLGGTSSPHHPRGFILSSALCFGGGVLFATAIVDILPDVREGLPFWSEFVFCSGFLLVYFIDTIVHCVHSRQPTPIISEYYSTRRQERNYGAITEPNDEDHVSVSSRESSETYSAHIPLNMSPSCSNFSLLFAFSVHSLLEGLVIGLADKKSKVLLLLLAVCCHKLLVAFCLGAELASDGRPLHRVLPPLSVFIFGSAAGVGVGAALQPQSFHIPLIVTLIPILQGLAGGTLLYVVVSEILPREKHRLRLSPWGGLIQFTAMTVGFGIMSTLSLIS